MKVGGGVVAGVVYAPAAQARIDLAPPGR